MNNQIFLNKIKEYNTYYFNIQTNNIRTTLSYITNPINEEQKIKQIKKPSNSSIFMNANYKCKINCKLLFMSIKEKVLIN